MWRNGNKIQTKAEIILLKLIDITKEYKVDEESTLALHDVSIEFRNCEFVSILGPSGCGKTTLLNIIGGLDRYTSGDIQIDGISTKQYDDIDWDTYRNRRIGFVFQSYNLIPHMNILKNVALCLTLAGVGQEERKERAMEALRKVGLDTQARKKPNQLSGGQMQRVAIARALVNNPDIVLADEPTGALDTESGLQIMELLKEVAKDRLVIMVTHNPQLADEYSTRIVYLRDGEVVDDTMPYDSALDAEAIAEKKKAENEKMLEQAVEEAKEASEAQEGIAVVRSVKKVGKWMKCLIKRREKDKSSMKLSTAISLSWNNLISKKGRTFLTSIAGSIGIIGIILVLSLSNGVDKYITTLEENALSQYPIEVDETNLSLTSALSYLSADSGDRTKYPDSDEVYVQDALSKFLTNLDTLLATNDLAAFKKYIDENFDTSLGTVKYDYGTTMNVYCNYVEDPSIYMKVSPFIDSMNALLSASPTLSGLLSSIDMSSIEQFASLIQSSAWDEMSSDQRLLNQQYDLLGGSRWPTSANEVVVVLDEKNQIMDYMQFVLGVLPAKDAISLMTSGTSNGKTYSVEQLLGLEYQVLSDSDYFYYDEATESYKSYAKTSDSIEFVESKGVTVKVVGVVRPKEGAGVTSINGIIGYTHALTELLISESTNSDVAKAQYAEYQQAVLTMAAGKNEFKNMTDQQILDAFESKSESERNDTDKYSLYIESIVDFSYTSSGIAGTTTVTVEKGDYMSLAEYDELMLQFGVADLARPKSIQFYCASFDSKDKIEAFIQQYIDESGNDIKYTDYLSMIMGYVGTLTTTVTGVLVGFAAISLIVSTIMIAIIIYTSVLERRKEIGVLRSIGARKKDISRVFLAESAILGGYSGLIGLFFSYLLSLFGSAILSLYFQINGLMTITWWHCVMMFFISVLLSMFAGFIPSRIAAKKDPAIALRSE